MNLQTIKLARQARLSHQTQLLYAVDEQGYRIADNDGPVLDLDRAPVVLRDLGVPPVLSMATLATSKFAEVDAVREWLVDLLNRVSTQYCVVLIGDGSNYTAAAVLRNAVKRARTVAWYEWAAFTERYTARITRDRLLDRSASPEEVAEAASEVYAAEGENDNLRHVYDVLAIIDFDINNVRDFAVPEICALIRHRTSFGLTTVFTVPTAESGAMDLDARNFGARGALIRLFENEALVFDGR